MKQKTKLQSFSIKVNGAHLVCDHSGVLYWPEKSVLVVSDLHLEKSSSFARHGQLLPPYDTHNTLLRLMDVVERYDPEILISLGDSFHDNGGAKRLSQQNSAMLSQLTLGRRVIWIAGNHDNEKTVIAGEWMTEICIGPLTFRHEPSTEIFHGEIAGHLHPAARIVRRGMSIRRFCFVSDGKRMILPAFGAYSGGLELSHKAFQPLFDTKNLIACLLGNGYIYPVRRNAFYAG